MQKRKRSQQERDEKLKKKIDSMSKKRARKVMVQQQADQKTSAAGTAPDVEPVEEVGGASRVEVSVVASPEVRMRKAVDELEKDWNPSQAAGKIKRKRGKNEIPEAWNMRIADIEVGDFVVLEAEYDEPAAKGISVAQVIFVSSVVS